MEKENKITHCSSKMALTTACAITKQFGSTMPSSPQILAVHTKTEDTELHFRLRFAEKQEISKILPTMSFLICSVMGMGLTASGEINLVKMVTASFSMPEKDKAGHHYCSFLQRMQINSGAREKNLIRFNKIVTYFA